MLSSRLALCLALTVFSASALTVEEEACVGENANRPNCARAQCAQHKYCDTCTKDLRCGWCESDKLCQPGIAAGPSKANCTTWDFAMCSALPCSQHTSCDSCASDPMCGWCATSNICTEGGVRGPVFMTCMKKDWLAEADQCTALYQAPCPCPEADGITCKSKEKCERNNWVSSQGVAAAEEYKPADLGDNKWYDSVEDQIFEDVPIQSIMPPEPEQEPAEPEPETYPQPASEQPNIGEGEEMPH